MADQVSYKDLNPDFIARIEKAYGPIDKENDFFSQDLSTYYKTDGVDPETRTVSHKLISLASFGDSLKKLSHALKALVALRRTEEGKKDSSLDKIEQELRDIFNVYRTHLRRYYPDQYKQIQQQLEEISTTGGGEGASSFTPGTGMQYSTPFAFNKNKKAKGTNRNIMTKKFGYKLVPDKIKNSGLEVKNLFEAETAQDFQNKRIAAFDQVESELNDIYKMLSNAKNETSQYYNDNPSSYAVVKPTDLILDYLKDIKNLLTDEE